MNVLLSSMELATLTGQPMYTYHLAKGFKELGHDVIVVSEIHRDEMKKMFSDIGVRHYLLPTHAYQGTYDMAIVSEQNSCVVLDRIRCKNIFNLLHSKHPVDSPIESDKIKAYVAPRQQILDHHFIDGHIIEIPIDIKKFQVPLVEHEGYRIIAPCTREMLRKPMLLDLIERSKDCEVWMVGKDHDALLNVDIPENVKVMGETNDVVSLMRQCDEVAGIFEGTVSYEGAAMGLKTAIYDEYGDYEYKVLTPHDYIEITNKFINLYGR